jgi:hypothetical protein
MTSFFKNADARIAMTDDEVVAEMKLAQNTSFSMAERLSARYGVKRFARKATTELSWKLDNRRMIYGCIALVPFLTTLCLMREYPTWSIGAAAVTIIASLVMWVDLTTRRDKETDVDYVNSIDARLWSPYTESPEKFSVAAVSDMTGDEARELLLGLIKAAKLEKTCESIAAEAKDVLNFAQGNGLVGSGKKRVDSANKWLDKMSESSEYQRYTDKVMRHSADKSFTDLIHQARTGKRKALSGE